MALVDDLALVGQQDYARDSPLGLEQLVFYTLDSIRQQLSQRLPDGYSVSVSRGVGGLPDGLWVAILDDAITRTPTEGIYLVFLFNRERTTVSLSLNQGIAHAGEVARTLPMTRNQLLRLEAQLLRDLLPKPEIEEYEVDIALGPGGRLSGYEAGNVIAKTWSLDNLPPNDALLKQLDKFLDLYEVAVAAKEFELTRNPGRFTTPARGEPRKPPFLPIFAPKDSSDYLIHALTYTDPQVRRRNHERLVEDFGHWARGRGFTAATNVHPIDLVLLTPDVEIITEVKVLDTAHPAGGVRESIGQLFEYRKFLRAATPEAPLLAVYSECPGGAFVELLTELKIAAVWRHDALFQSSPMATMLGL